MASSLTRQTARPRAGRQSLRLASKFRLARRRGGLEVWSRRGQRHRGLVARRRLRIANVPLAHLEATRGPLHQIDVDVILVVAVRTRSQDGREARTGTGL